MLVTPYITKAVDIRRRCKKTPGVLLSVNGTYRPLDIDTHAYRNDPLRLIQFRVAFTSTHLRIYTSLIVSIPNHPTSDIYSIAWMDRFFELTPVSVHNPVRCYSGLRLHGSTDTCINRTDPYYSYSNTYRIGATARNVSVSAEYKR